ncbi:BamA/TamA family outer membrane protein [Microbulbifer pacificus]|uniref:Uncharacterized protein n=1 Tax=Microbulbifer pacificus TaxID=407164 RepID=A0AAU0MYK7_9GAMM|nr:hypothetical protein [Microbulbifer pacificus]WOX05132.1 hypothetical protein R5R33_15510 [Microbulbifer pacificus]
MEHKDLKSFRAPSPLKMGKIRARGATIYSNAILVAALSGLIPYSALAANELEGAEIKSIKIVNNNIFDENSDDYTSLLSKGVNLLHIKTQKEIIEKQLLFKVGDQFSEQKAEETERILRRNKYICDAKIYATKVPQGVEIQVITSDTWSTKPALSFGHTGGASKNEAGIEEDNLLGLGLSLSISYKQDADRSATNFRLADNYVFNSNHKIELQRSNLSDGTFNSLLIEKPFISLDSRSSYRLNVNEYSRMESRYHLGEKYVSFDRTDEELELNWGWSDGISDDGVWRHSVGLQSRKARATLSSVQPDLTDTAITSYVDSLQPEYEKREIYPYYAVNFLENKYDKTINFDKIGRTEDRYLGTELGFQIGAGGSALGSSENFMRISGFANRNDAISRKIFLRSGFLLDGYYSIETGSFTDSTFKYYSTLDIYQTNSFRFHSSFTGLEAYNWNYYSQLLVDEDNGLRGYPRNFLSGDRIHNLSFEERYYSNLTLFGMFNFGAAVFMDVSRVSGGTEFEQQENGIYRSLGVGLRISNNRSSSGEVIHLDLATPLDAAPDNNNYQFSISAQSKF